MSSSRSAVTERLSCSTWSGFSIACTIRSASSRGESDRFSHPVSPGLTWSALNVGLPHVLVTQISYTPSMTLQTVDGPQERGDVLLISTLGRGVYEINKARVNLGKTNVVTITGPDPGASIVITPDLHIAGTLR